MLLLRLPVGVDDDRAAAATAYNTNRPSHSAATASVTSNVSDGGTVRTCDSGTCGCVEPRWWWWDQEDPPPTPVAVAIPAAAVAAAVDALLLVLVE